MLGEFSKVLVFIGIAIALIGGVIYFFDKLGFKGLPGDIFIKKDNLVFYFPIVTSILLSFLLSILLTVIFNFFKK